MEITQEQAKPQNLVDLGPANSYEVTFVITHKNPKFKSGLSKEELLAAVDKERREQLVAWADRHATAQWLVKRI